MPMTQEQLENLNRTFVQFKEANDVLHADVKKYGDAGSETKVKVEKINDRLDTIETDIKAQLASQAKAAEVKALTDRINELEAKLSRKGSFATGSAEEKKEEIAKRKGIFFKALRSGTPTEARQALEPEEFKSLTLSNDTSGGYLAPPEYVMEIISDVVLWSNIRSIARTRTTSRTSVMFPMKIRHAKAAWVKETGSRDETQNPQWGMEEIATHELYALAQVSKADLEDSLFDLEQFLKDEFSEQFGVAEGAGFVVGNNIGKPEGFLSNSGIEAVPSGSATVLTADGIIDLYFSLKEAYLNNAMWVMSRPTLKDIRKMKDGDGNYIWTPGIKVSAEPSTILDRPYMTAVDMPSVAGAANPIAFGDFKRGYLIVDRIVIEMLTDPYSAKKTGMIEFSARKRVGGKVILAEAIKKQVIST